MPERDAILLIRAGGLGDLVVALPAIALVRRSRPEAGLTLLARLEYGSLIRHAGLVDEVLPVQDSSVAGLFSGRGVLPGRLGGGVDAVIGWVQNAASPFRTVPWDLYGARRTVFVTARMDAPVPLSRQFFEATRELLGAWTAAGPGGRSPAANERDDLEALARLPVPEDAVRDAGRPFGPEAGQRGRFAVIHPGSGSKAKRWPLERFLRMAGILAEAGRPGIFVTGEADEDLAIRLAGSALPEGWLHEDRPAAGTLAARLAACGLYLGNDSGVTHLAAACGTKVVALFSEANLPAWRPFGKTTVLAAAKVDEIEPARVESALLELMRQER